MEQNGFYELGEGLFDKGWAYSEREENSTSSFEARDKCPLCGSYRGMAVWQPPYEVKLSAKKIGDFIFGNICYFIVSESFKIKYELSGLIGIRDFIRLDRLRFRKEIIPLPYYWVIPERVQLRPIPIEVDTLAESLEIPYCPVCSKPANINEKNPKKVSYCYIGGEKGLIMDTNSQTYIPDVFITYIRGELTYCTQRFVDFCREHKFTNFETQIVSFENYARGRYYQSKEHQ